MATVVDPEGLDFNSSGPRTYYLKIEVDCPYSGLGGSCFFKFGLTNRPIKKRFSGESPDLKITVLQIWRHESAADAKVHEEKLFKRYNPTRLFWGFPPCPPANGPLSVARGNTELFLADRVNGQKDVKLPHATFIDDYTFSGHFSWKRAYVAHRHSHFRHGQFPPAWLDWLSSPNEGYSLLPLESMAKSRLIFIRDDYLNTEDYHHGSKRKWGEWIEQARWVGSFEAAERLSGIDRFIRP